MGEWFDVPGYEEFYQITRSGDMVRSKPRRVNSPITGGTRVRPSKLLTLLDVKGYWALQAKGKAKKATLYVHRILAGLFIPNPDNKPCINHIDGDKKNNSLENLEWCTHLENMRHAYRTGLATAPDVGPGERCPAAKLNDEKVRDIKRRLRAGETHKALAAEYGVAKGTVGFIARGETWGHIEP